MVTNGGRSGQDKRRLIDSTAHRSRLCQQQKSDGKMYTAVPLVGSGPCYFLLL
jgi:hypothetical protein